MVLTSLIDSVLAHYSMIPRSRKIAVSFVTVDFPKFLNLVQVWDKQGSHEIHYGKVTVKTL